MMDNKNIINENDFDNVSGGVIFNAKNISGANRDYPWEVLDDHTGNNIYEDDKKICFATRDEAVSYAQGHGQNVMEVNWDQVLQMRGLK